MTGLLNFTSATLTLAYFVLCFLASLGVLQIVAAREGLVGLTLVRARRPWAGYAMGVLLIVVAFAAFFAAQHELVFQPGLAGSELFVVFGLAALAALLFTLGVASLCQRRDETVHTLPNPSVASNVTFGQAGFRGRLYKAAQAADRLPAVCLVPSPFGDLQALDPLAESLAEAGWVALAVDWSAMPTPGYPEVLAMLPAALGHLARQEDVSADRLALVGFDLGADLVLRAASSDPSVSAVVALAPLLSPDVADFGLGLLRERSYSQAWRRSGPSHRLLAELQPVARLDKLANRRMLVVYGGEDGIVDVEKASDILRQAGPGCLVKVLPGEGHRAVSCSPRAVSLVTSWLKQQSAGGHGEHV